MLQGLLYPKDIEFFLNEVVFAMEPLMEIERNKGQEATIRRRKSRTAEMDVHPGWLHCLPSSTPSTSGSPSTTSSSSPPFPRLKSSTKCQSLHSSDQHFRSLAHPTPQRTLPVRPTGEPTDRGAVRVRVLESQIRLESAK